MCNSGSPGFESDELMQDQHLSEEDLLRMAIEESMKDSDGTQ